MRLVWLNLVARMLPAIQRQVVSPGANKACAHYPFGIAGNNRQSSSGCARFETDYSTGVDRRLALLIQQQQYLESAQTLGDRVCVALGWRAAMQFVDECVGNEKPLD